MSETAELKNVMVGKEKTKKDEHIYIAKELSLQADSSKPSPEHLELINQYSQKELTEDDVIVFPIHAMNDGVDRDFDRFSKACIESLASDTGDNGVLGKPFLCSHLPGDLAKGRIYKVETEEEEGVTHLKPWIYIPNTPQYAEFIENILYGIYWAVSVGVIVNDASCIICGASWPNHFQTSCSSNHKKGLKYDGQLCYRSINGIHEFMELSTVYLGAQYGAQVVSKMADDKVSTTLSILRDILVEEDVNKEVEIKQEEVLKPYPNEHACRLCDPDKYESFKRQNGSREHDGKKYDVIFGIIDGKAEEQAYRYPKKSWTAQEASEHCKSHKGMFEEAGTEESILTNESTWPEVSKVTLDFMMDGEDFCKECLEPYFQKYEKEVPWSKSKITDLIDEGAEVTSDEAGIWTIRKGHKVWTYDGTRLIREEVKKVKEQLDKLQEEVKEKAEEIEALDIKIAEKDEMLKESKELMKAMEKELETAKEELERKSKVVDSYLSELKKGVIKWYRLSKGEKEEPDTAMLERLLERCGDDPELLSQLEADYREQAERFYPSTRRSTVDEGVEEKDETEAEEEDTDTNGLADSLHK